MNGDNTVTYSPESWFDGTDNFTYMVTDVDGDYDIASVSVVVMAGTLPGITVSDISGNTVEDGTTASFTVTLETQPTTDVTIDLVSDDVTEGTISSSTLTFTNSNWNTPQTITLTGQDDYIDDGDIDYQVIFDNAVSTDPLYNGLSIEKLGIINIDNDTARVIVSIDDRETSEDLLNTSFEVVLNSQPLSDVILSLSSSNETEGDLESSQITFTSSNWNVAQEVEIYGVDDDTIDGDIIYEIILSSTSTDPLYNEIDITNLELTNLDNDSTVIEGLTIPEAFSPGNDGFNDFFEILGLGNYEQVSIKIYNRWGSLVYTNNAYANDWDGKSNVSGTLGSELPTGTYFYIIKINDTGEKKNGYVFLKR